MDVDPDDPLMQYDAQQLLAIQQEMKDKLSAAKMRRGMLAMEADMIHDFNSNTRHDIKETEARIKNLDTDMETLNQNHVTQLKVFNQKIKHMEFDHSMNIEDVKMQAEKYMLEQRQYHRQQKIDMIYAKKK